MGSFLGRASTILVFGLCFQGSSARAADEAALLALWGQITAKPDDHGAAIKACRDFAATHAGDPLLPVARGIEEWHLMRTGSLTEATSQMTTDLSLPSGAVNEGARRLAQAWLTRTARNDIDTALQAYYRKNVAYPKTLDQLPLDGRPPLNDRFGQPWDYRLTGFGKLKGFDDQKYALTSAYLGKTSDFPAALKLPYASLIQATPIQVLPGLANTEAVKFRLSAREPVIGVGQAVNDLFLAFVGARIVVVCDYLHWKILPRP